MPAHDTATAAIRHCNACGNTGSEARGREHGVGVDGRQAEIVRKPERPTVRQQEAIARCEPNRIGKAVNRQPAFTGDHRVALDPVMLAELNRPFATHIKAARNIATRLQQRQHV